MKKSIKTKALKHLKEDIAGYKKERKSLKHEIKEDKELAKALKGSKNGSPKKSKPKKKSHRR